MRKKLLIGASLGLLIILIVTQIAHAVTWTFSFPVTITDTSNTTRTYYPVTLNATGQQYISGGYINANGLNTNMQIGSTSIKYMLGTTKILTVVPNLPGGGRAITTFYTGYSPEQTFFPIIVGDGGYITTNDTAALEPTNNFTISLNGYFDATKSGNLISKPNSIVVASNGAGNVTATISGIALSNDSANTLDTTVGIAGIIRQGERLNSVPAGDFGSVNLTLAKTNLPTGTANITIRKVSDDSILAAFGTIDVSTLGAGYATYTFTFNGTGSFTNPVTQDLRVLIEYDNVVPGAYVRVLGQNTNAYAGGTETSYVAAYTDQPLQDNNFALFGSNQIVMQNVTSGEQTISLYGNGTNIWLSNNTVSSSNISAIIFDNSSNWSWMESNTFPYMNHIYLYINGVITLAYQPELMIVGNIIPDLLHIKDGDITWGTNTNITLHAGTMVSNNSTVSTGSNATVGFTMPTVSLPNNWFGGGSTTTLPFYDMFNSVSTSSGVSTQMIYFIIAIAFAFLAMLLVMRFTRSNLLGIIVFNSILFMGTSNNVVPMWVAFSSTLVQFGILYLSRQV